MLVTLNWLKDFVELDGLTPQEIADKFTFSGFEIEQFIDYSKPYQNVIVGRVDEIIKHPNADKLLVCQIFDGRKQYQIITHATNMKVGDLVPVALDGAELPNGVNIKPTNMRGLDSCGMMCAGEELGIDNTVYPGAETDGIMIIDSKDATVGENIAKLLGKDDVVFEVNVLSNRPDCQSVLGLAKELACATGRKLKTEKIEEMLKFEAKTADLPLKIESKTQNCPYFIGQVVRNIKLQPSPRWMQNRLRLVGIRPLNNIIDITNYVLWEMGQPMHAYDYAQIEGGLCARQATKGESIKTLNQDQTLKLNPEIMVIADQKKVVGLAGVVGGEDFSIQDSTTDIIFESATFKKENVRQTARGFGIRSDAGARYEKGVEPISCELGLKRALALVQELGAGDITKSTHRSTQLDFTPKVQEFDFNRIQQWLGMEIDSKAALDILGRLGFNPTLSGHALKCEIPALRTDIEGFADIAEELIRTLGFDRVPTTHEEVSAATDGGFDSEIRQNLLVRQILRATSAHEISTFTFISPKQFDKINLVDQLKKAVKIQNPLSLDYSIMRNQMLGSMLEAVAYNISRKNEGFALFEVGKIFSKNAEELKLPHEEEVLSFVTIEPDADFFSIKSITEMLAQQLGLGFLYKQATVPFFHPNIGAEIVIGNQKVGLIGKIHPTVLENFGIDKDVFYFEIYLKNLPEKKTRKMKPLPKYPSSVRDLAIVVAKEVNVGELLAAIKKSAGVNCEEVKFFDLYEGEKVASNEKSVAFRLLLRKLDGTLTQEEINGVVEKVVSDLAVKFNAKLRV